MVSKNLPMGIKFFNTSQYSFLVSMSRWEHHCIPELLFGSIPFQTILIQGNFTQVWKVLAWYIDSNDIGKQPFVKCPYLLDIKTCVAVCGILEQCCHTIICLWTTISITWRPCPKVSPSAWGASLTWPADTVKSITQDNPKDDTSQPSSELLESKFHLALY